MSRGDKLPRPKAMNATEPLRRSLVIAAIAVVAIVSHFALICLASTSNPRAAQIPLLAALVLGGTPLVFDLAMKALRREFGSDLLAGMSIITSLLLGEYLAGVIVILMLAGGEALESYAVASASSALSALAKRLPSLAHRRQDGRMTDVLLSEVAIGDVVAVFLHEICPVDGVVVEGRGVMDESFLTGEPYRIAKAPGAMVLSGAINGDSAMMVRAERLAADSRYAKIMQVMRESEQRRPRMRRLGDRLGAWYTPFAVLIALAAWAFSHDPRRFLAVLVVATPCPLLIAIPVAIIGSISLAARRRIIVRDPAVLERVDSCTTAIFDKTGTLTYGRPGLVELIVADGWLRADVLAMLAALEQYSKHPLAAAIVAAAATENLTIPDVTSVSEPPGQGLTGTIESWTVEVTNRAKDMAKANASEPSLPATTGGLECVVLINGNWAAVLRFRDQPRRDSASFIQHLAPRHRFQRLMLVSGDRAEEVGHLAKQVGIQEVHAAQSPEQKLAIVRAETERANTLFLGDGINDAPALAAATVGIAFGQNSDVTTEAAGAVILDSSLETVDEFLHISRRLRMIVLQSAGGGMALSGIAMLAAAAGLLPPVVGALVQEIIDVAAVTNSLRAAFPRHHLTDFGASPPPSGPLPPVDVATKIN